MKTQLLTPFFIASRSIQKTFQKLHTVGTFFTAFACCHQTLKDMKCWCLSNSIARINDDQIQCIIIQLSAISGTVSTIYAHVKNKQKQEQIASKAICKHRMVKSSRIRQIAYRPHFSVLFAARCRMLECRDMSVPEYSRGKHKLRPTLVL